MAAGVPERGALVAVVTDDAVLLERFAVQVATVGDDGQARVGQQDFAVLGDAGGRQDAAFGTLDSNKYKDLVGRVGIDKDFIAGGVSAWYGADEIDTSDGSGI